MKKRTVSILALISVAAALISSPLSSIYFPSSPVTTGIRTLSVLGGKALPSPFSLWSGEEALFHLGAIDEDTLSGEGEVLRRSILSLLETDGDDYSILVRGSVNWENYIHSATDVPSRSVKNSFTKSGSEIREKAFTGSDWEYGGGRENAFLTLSAAFSAYDTVTAYTALSLMNSSHRGADHSRERGSTPVSTNIPLLPTWTPAPLVLGNDWPETAYLSIRGKGWSAVAGRGRLSMGYGMDSSLIISDTLPFHDFLSFSVFNPLFKYSYLISFFPHTLMYTASDGSYNALTSSDHMETEGIRFYTAHRLEKTFLEGRVNLGVTEGLMYASGSGAVDPRVLNPLFVMHNAYIPSVANSTLSIDASCSPFPGLALYFSFILDDMNVGPESSPSETRKGAPGAAGWLLGAIYAFASDKGIGEGYVEVTKTYPFLYLRNGVDYVVAVRTFSNSTDWNTAVYDEYTLGSKYGPDALSLVSAFTFTSLESRFSLGAKARYTLQGTHDEWTVWSETGGEGSYSYSANTKSPTCADDTENRKYDNSKRNATEKTLALTLSGGYGITEKTTVSADISYVRKWNLWNEKGRNAEDLQLVLSLSFSF